MATAALFATPRVLKALRSLLLADRQIVTRLGQGPQPDTPAIYAEAAVPQTQTTGEYLTIGPFSEVPADTMGATWGSTLTTAIKVVSYSSDVAPGYALCDQVIARLHGQSLVVEGYAIGWVTLDVVPDAYVELVAGVPVTHFPMLFRIHVHEG